jgi:hypothetical protein
MYSLWERFGRKVLKTALFRLFFAGLEPQRGRSSWMLRPLRPRQVPNETAGGDRV